MKVFLLIIALLTLTDAAVRAQHQPAPAERVAAVRDAYQALDYGVADTLARAALADYATFSPAQLTELHTLVALIAFTRNDLDAARRAFDAALSLNPDLTLDPLLVSPKILDFFSQVKTERTARQTTATPPTETIRYVPVKDPGGAAAMRSLLVPGWGQLYKGQTAKGWLLVGLWGTTASGTVLAHLARNDAEAAYLAEADPDRIADRFATFNRRHKLRNNLALATAAVWAIGYVDALLVGNGTVARHMVIAPASVGVRVRF